MLNILPMGFDRAITDIQQGRDFLLLQPCATIRKIASSRRLSGFGLFATGKISWLNSVEVVDSQKYVAP